MLHYTKGGVWSTESLINQLKSKHKIHVINESEDRKTIPAQKEILSQILNKEMSLFDATKKRSNNLEKLYHVLITIKPTSVEPERDFSATVLFVIKNRNRLNDQSVLWLSNIIKQLCLTHY